MEWPMADSISPVVRSNQFRTAMVVVSLAAPRRQGWIF